MSSTKKPERSTRARAFRFGLGALVLLGGFGALLWWRKHHAVTGGSIAGVGAALLLLALAWPAGALGVRTAWMKLAGAIGWVNSRILLGVLFFVVLTPISLFRRLGGAREAYRPRRGGDGYWRNRDKEYDPKHYEHPY
jgi:Saxitoxin biosynthesis operon protein SxtJ